jgi:hypothetical protein
MDSPNPESFSDMTPEALATALPHIERYLGWPTGTLVRLADESDWSFVVRCAVMIVASLSTMLRRVEPKLEAVIRELPMRHSKYGMVAVAKSLDLISEQQKCFIDHVMEMRNDCAHDVAALSYSLAGHLDALDRSKQARFFESLEFGLPAGELEPNRVAFRRNPKLGTLSAVLRLITHGVFTIIWHTVNVAMHHVATSQFRPPPES